MAYEGNPTKAQGEKALVPQLAHKSLVPRLAQMMEGWRKEYPPTKKKLPVGIYVPERLSELGMSKDATEMVKVVVDCTVITFYYLL